MSNWLTVKNVANILNLSESFIRTTICKEEFKDFCHFGRPILIYYNNEFKKLIYKYVKKCNIKHNNKHDETKQRIFNENQNKIVNSNIILKWTQSSIDCYKIGCNCARCNVKKIINTKCYMKQIVIELVKKFGAPNESEEDNMSIIGYFKAGIENYFKAEKKTPKIKTEAKELINQFRISEQYEEFEDLEEYKIMKSQIKQIYDEIYNNK